MSKNCDNPSFTITQKGDTENLSNKVVTDKFDALAAQIKTEFESKIKKEKIVKDKDTMKLLEETTNNLAEKIKAEAKTTSYTALGPYLNLIFHLMENGDTNKEQLKNTITELGNLINNTPNSNPGTLIDGIFSPAEEKPPPPPPPPPPPTEGDTSIVLKEMPDPQNVDVEKETTTQAEAVTKLATPDCPSAALDITKLDCDKKARRTASLSLHPDKNTKCEDEAKDKFVEYNKMCDKRAESEDNSAPAAEPLVEEPIIIPTNPEVVVNDITPIVPTETPTEHLQLENKPIETPLPPIDDALGTRGEIDLSVDELELGVPTDPMDTPGKTRNEAAVNRARAANPAAAEAKRKLKLASDEAAKAAKETAAAATTEAAEAATAAATEAAEKAAEDTIIKFQAGLRGNSSRNKTQKLKTDKNAAATKLQKTLRQKSAQRKADEKSKEDKAAIETETAAVSVSDLKKNIELIAAQDNPSPPKPDNTLALRQSTARRAPYGTGKMRKKGGGKKTQKGGKKVVKKVDKKKTKRSGKMGGKNKTKRRKN